MTNTQTVTKKTDPLTARHTSRQKNRQTDAQEYVHTNRWINNQTFAHINLQTHRHMDEYFRQMNAETLRQAFIIHRWTNNRQVDIQTDQQANSHRYIWTYREIQ